MNRLCLVVVVLVAGCSPPKPPQRLDLLCECYSDAAYAAYAVKARPKTPDVKPHERCCSECGGTGRVRSGDNQSWVSCPCPDSCQCKSRAKR